MAMQEPLMQFGWAFSIQTHTNMLEKNETGGKCTQPVKIIKN